MASRYIPNPFLAQQAERSAFTRADLRARGQIVLERARSLAPSLTGALRDSLQAELGPANERARVVIGTEIAYAAFVEFGTEDTPAVPYLRPALESVRGLVH